MSDSLFNSKLNNAQGAQQNNTNPENNPNNLTKPIDAKGMSKEESDKKIQSMKKKSKGDKKVKCQADKNEVE